MSTYKTFLCRYLYNDTWWAFSIKARDFIDAHRRMMFFGGAVMIDGELE